MNNYRDRISQTFSEASIFVLVFWCAVFLANSEPELGSLFSGADHPAWRGGAMAGMFCSLYLVAFLVILLLEAMEVGIKNTQLKSVIIDAGLFAFQLSALAIGGFVHGYTELYFQYSPAEFAPKFAGVFMPVWLLVILVKIIASIGMDDDRQNTPIDRTISEPLSWSIPDDK